VYGHKAKRVTRKVLVARSTPEITLRGPKGVSLYATHERYYQDRGASCTDEVDGKLSFSHIDGVRRVDLSKPGTYEVTFYCKNKVGIEAHTARTVTVMKKALTTCPRGMFLAEQDCHPCSVGTYKASAGPGG
jgi:hypothetical protein